MKILITGGNGQLGRCLQDVLQHSNHEFFAPAKSDLDISDESSVDNAIRSYRPDVVVNTAAYTAVDNAEKESDIAFLVNETSLKHLANSCKVLGIPLIHISTDYVFSGMATSPYKSDDQTAPLSIYGKSKLAGEQAIRSLWEKHIIVRTAWVFSEYGNNFVKTILRLAQSRDSLKIVADQWGCPTYAGDLAIAIVKICDELQHKSAWGTYHYAGATSTNWHGFASAIIQRLSKSIPVLPISTAEFPTLATRPNYSILDCSSTIDTWNVKLSDWQGALEKVIPKLTSC
ncbi:MAG TPA: dTDP-4-dehydrorhamnose reductase [Cellvibrio sp.]|nr:dTDP-4-dehydrorhamnose reductase [Cellvibrio sp.]